MAVTTFSGWVADGRPWDPAFPVDDLAICLRGYGYTVYVLGNQDHATAQPPQDHMPYSHTPWPGRQPYPYVLALDIMPPPAGKKLPSLAKLGAQLYKDKQAGVPGVLWIKYMNWEPSGSSGPCYHDSWQPNHARTRSTDRGHIHISGRTDFVTSHAAAGYDPIARIRGEDVALTDAEIQKIADRTVETLLKKNLPIPQIWMDAFPDDPSIQDGEIGYDTCVRSGYFHARQANDQTKAPADPPVADPPPTG